MRQEAAPQLARRLFHLCGGSLFPILALFLSREMVLLGLSVATGGWLAMEAARFVFPGVNCWLLSHFSMLFREQERSRLTGSSYLLISSLLAFSLFDKGIAIAAVFFLAAGDALAGIIGDRFGRRIIFNKTLEGSLAFLVCSLVIGMVLTTADLDLFPSLVVAGAIAACAVELLPLPLDDNLTVPLFSGGVMAAMEFFFG